MQHYQFSGPAGPVEPGARLWLFNMTEGLWPMEPREEPFSALVSPQSLGVGKGQNRSSKKKAEMASHRLLVDGVRSACLATANMIVVRIAAVYGNKLACRQENLR